MTSVIELSTSVGFSSALAHTAAAAGATLAEIEAKLAAAQAARTQRPAADGITLSSNRCAEERLRICQEETAAATARMLQVLPAHVHMEKAALALIVARAYATMLLDKRTSGHEQRCKKIPAPKQPHCAAVRWPLSSRQRSTNVMPPVYSACHLPVPQGDFRPRRC